MFSEPEVLSSEASDGLIAFGWAKGTGLEIEHRGALDVESSGQSWTVSRYSVRAVFFAAVTALKQPCCYRPILPDKL